MFAADAARRARHREVARTRCRRRKGARQNTVPSPACGGRCRRRKGERGKAALLLALCADRRAPPSALRAASPAAQGKRKPVFRFFHSLWQRGLVRATSWFGFHWRRASAQPKRSSVIYPAIEPSAANQATLRSWSERCRLTSTFSLLIDSISALLYVSPNFSTGLLPVGWALSPGATAQRRDPHQPIRD